VIVARGRFSSRRYLDAEPTADGNVRVFGDGMFIVIDPDDVEMYRAVRQELYRFHTVSCPIAAVRV
jgi:hypothetical protein